LWTEDTREAFDNGRPVSVIGDPNHSPPEITEALISSSIAFSRDGGVVDGAVHKDRNVSVDQSIDEVGLGAGIADTHLRIVRQAVASTIEEVDEATLE
jgi:hypothetical protein